MASDTIRPIPKLMLARIHTVHASDMSQILRVTCGDPMRAAQESEDLPGAMCLVSLPQAERQDKKPKGNESISS